MAATWRCPACGTEGSGPTNSGLLTCTGCNRPVPAALPASNTVTVAPPGQADSQATQDHVRSDATPTVSSPSLANRTTSSAETTDARAPAGYVIERELGRGGMGIVYLARQTRLNRPCALKMILSGGHAGESERERFETEAQAIARLQHDNIVRVYEIGEHQGQPFMALEFCEGGSLDRKLRDRQPTPREAAILVRTLAHGMQAAHEARVIHRDLKPANVLLAADGTPKVTDFGLAKKLDEDGATRTGSIMGTPSYMPPEQARGEGNLGLTVDVYALGAILYECLTGRPPFKAATPLETLRQVLENDPVAVKQLNPSIPLDLETIVHKCLQKDVTRRYTSARELADDLERYLAGEPIVARPVGVFERATKWVRRNPVVSVLTATVLLVLTAGLVTASLLVAWALTEKENAEAQTGIARTQEAVATTQAGLARARAEDLLREKEEVARQKQNAEQQTEIARQAQIKTARQLLQTELARYAGQLAQAQRHFQDEDVVRGRAILEECQWNLRGIEYSYLSTRYNARQSFVQHNGPRQNTACWHPDGKHIASGGQARENTQKKWCGSLKIWNAETGQEVRSFEGHKGRVTNVAFSVDGKRMVSASTGNDNSDLELGPIIRADLRVWDAEKGELLHSLQGHRGEVTCVAFSPDGKHCISGGTIVRIISGEVFATGVVKVWDVESGKAVLTFTGHPDHVVTSVCYSPDGKRIVSACGRDEVGGELKVWEAATGKELLTMGQRDRDEGNGWTRSVAYSPDGKYIVSASNRRSKVSESGEVHVWDAATGKLIRTLQRQSRGNVASVCFSPDGRRICSSGDRNLNTRDATTGQLILTIPIAGHLDSQAQYSPDGRRLLTVNTSADQSVQVWDAEVGQEIRSLKGDKDKTGITVMSFSPGGKRIAAAGGSSLVIWHAETGEQQFSSSTFRGGVNSVAFSPDGKRIVVGTGESNGYVLDIEQGKYVVLRGHHGGITNVACTPDGKRILTASQGSLGDGKAKLWDAGSGTEILTLKGNTTDITSLCFSPDGQRILTGGGKESRGRHLPGEARVWEAESGQEVLTLKGITARVVSVAFNPQGTRMLTRSEDGNVKVWNAETGLELRSPGEPAISASFSPEGKRLVTGSADRKVRVWDTETCQEIWSLSGHLDPVGTVVWTPDGKRIISGSGRVNFSFNPGNAPGEIKIWDAEMGQELLTLHGHADLISHLTVSSDGRRFASASLDHSLKLWMADRCTPALLLHGHQSSVTHVAFSPDGKHLASAGNDGAVKLWDMVKGREAVPIQEKCSGVRGLAFSPDGLRVLAWNYRNEVQVWSVESGLRVDSANPSTVPPRGSSRSPDGNLLAELRGSTVAVLDTRPAVPNAWPLPALAERKRYHTDQAVISESETKWFAVAFHLGRLLLDDPENADLKRRRDEAVKKHAGP